MDRFPDPSTAMCSDDMAASPVTPARATTNERILTNARVVTPDAVFLGTVVVRDGVIAAVEDGRSHLAGAEDMDRDYLIPGLVELHTDNLERHVSPRPGVTWPSAHAILAHDAEVAAAGITTVFDALRLGTLREEQAFVDAAAELVDTIAAVEGDGLARSGHYVHLRCEISCDDVDKDLAKFLGSDIVRLVSVMDHTPGQRQFADLAKYREYYGGKYGFSEAELERFLEEAYAAQARNSDANRAAIVAMCAQHDIVLASHDDATAAHVEEALGNGVALAEFPTTFEAADACAEHGLHVLMGAPNLLRGRSHSGNVSARDLAARGVLDILSSDYVPASLLQAAFTMAEAVDAIDLPVAINAVSRNPAHAVGLDDRGEVAVGRRADLVRVHVSPRAAVVREVWNGGRRVV
jgi:alpha-D-ribose 1-methylphosphonate 5-triphosphate diphosphatase